MVPAPEYENAPLTARNVPNGVSDWESGKGQYHGPSIRETDDFSMAEMADCPRMHNMVIG
jgi:hypothetical protein